MQAPPTLHQNPPFIHTLAPQTLASQFISAPRVANNISNDDDASFRGCLAVYREQNRTVYASAVV